MLYGNNAVVRMLGACLAATDYLVWKIEGNLGCVERFGTCRGGVIG